MGLAVEQEAEEAPDAENCEDAAEAEKYPVLACSCRGAPTPAFLVGRSEPAETAAG